jgi:hypothetical protein
MRYFMGFLASLGLVVLVVILVIRGLSGSSTPENQTSLRDYVNTDALVRLTVDGPIVSDQEHRAYRITVGRSETRGETLSGYQYDTIDTKTYQNNQEGFTNFLLALQLAGFTRGVDDGKNTDERGVCAAGRRYIFEIMSGTSDVQRFWATSCGGQGTFKGDIDAVKELFTKQIPATDYPKFIGRLQL